MTLQSDKDFSIAARTLTALHRAIDEEDEELAMSELANPLNLEAARANGITPLVVAARKGAVRIVQALVDRGVKQEMKSAQGCTAFSCAAEEVRAALRASIR